LLVLLVLLALRGHWPATEPKNRESPKLKIPPSAATVQ
jgi:hypothetical protein